METTHAVDIEQYLSGLNYPCDKDTLINYVKRKTSDSEVVDMLNKLPYKEYENSSDVISSLDMEM